MAPTDRPPAAEAAAADADGPGSRASGVWPDTARLRGGGHSSHFEATRFDPLYEQKSRERWRLATQFDLCRPALGLRVLIFVQVALALAALPLAQGWLDAATRAVVLAFAGLGGALLWLPTVCALRPVLARLGRGPRELALAGLGGASALVGWAMVAGLGLVPPRWPSAAGSAVCGAALAALVWHWLGLRAAAAQPVEASARLAELQSRIRPHFLFNALNTALALVQVDPRKAEVVLEDLSQLFRVALAETGAAVTLDDEIDLAQRYLAIEKLRFGDRLQLEWDLDPEASAAPLPPLVLQPLVENAVRHGVEPALRGGRIQVRTRKVRGMAEVLVTNTLPDEPGRQGSGIALANVAERLRLLHDVAASLHTGIEDGRFKARIVVPL
ncbi:histidine kinase [Ideonella sp. A 288]|uniref:histidine kinase n=1 Tax=Ideonella sp. A 288 TaxID=1962181 RepID=UPI000B4B904C|nr:histidine kinase [Ideonella sp. A 288]